MRLAVLSSAALDDAVHFDVMNPPLEGRLSAMPNATLVRPPPLRQPTFRVAAPAWLSAIKVIRRVDTLFWVQTSARPAWPLWAIGATRPSARRSAWVIDPWLPSLHKIGRVAAIQRLSPLFVSSVRAVEFLRRRFPRGRFHQLPYAANVELFRERGYERDIFAFWMGAGQLPLLHESLREHCAARGLRYEWGVHTARQAGELASRCRYFVVVPPSLVDEVRSGGRRTGGMSNLPFRYFEGLAAGARLLGVLPTTGEYEALMPRDAVLEVRADGKGLSESLDNDLEDPATGDAVRRAQSHVHKEHTWERRAEEIHRVLESA